MGNLRARSSVGYGVTHSVFIGLCVEHRAPFCCGTGMRIDKEIGLSTVDALIAQGEGLVCMRSPDSAIDSWERDHTDQAMGLPRSLAWINRS